MLDLREIMSNLEELKFKIKKYEVRYKKTKFISNR